MRKDASQHGRQVNKQSKVMVKPITHFSKIQTYIYKKATHECISKHIHISFRINKIDEIQYDICMKRVGSVILRSVSSIHTIQP